MSFWENIKMATSVLRELNYILNRRQKRKAFIVCMVIVISSWFELLGVSVVLPFVQAAMEPDVILAKPYMKKIVNILDIHTGKELMILMGVGIIIVYILKNLFMIFSLAIQVDYSTRIQKELSTKMLQSYMSRPYEYFLNINSAEIRRGCVNDIDSVFSIVSALFSFIAEFLSVLLIGAFIIYTDFWIAIGVLFSMLIVLLGILVLFKSAVKRAGKKNLEASTAKNKAIYQASSGIKEIFVMQKRGHFLKAYENASETERKARRVYEILSGCPDRIVEGICISCIIGTVCVRMVYGNLDMADYIPRFSAFAVAAFRILPSIGKIANRLTTIVYHRPALSNVFHNMCDAEQHECDMKSYLKIKEGEDDLHFRKMLTVKDITWQYENQKFPILKEVNLSIIRGESIAFIGASGAGKTTLSDIILGLLKPLKGAVIMDGIDVYSIPVDWARIVGYVPQAVFLIDDTIRNNIAFGEPKSKIKDELVLEALEQAQLKAFVEGLPKGLDTVVGERGVRLSGGQKQRIAIARALYHKPEILVLDEATAALDNDTEAAVMEAIDALQGKLTMIIVAHRLTTIQKCNKIYEIVNGKIINREKTEILKN